MTLSKILGEKAAKYGVKCCTISLRLDVWARNVTGVLPCFSERNTANVRWSAEEQATQVIVAILGNLLCQMHTVEFVCLWINSIWDRADAKYTGDIPDECLGHTKVMVTLSVLDYSFAIID